MYRYFLALRYLRSRLVNFIAVGGVMFGVAVLIVVTSVMDGFRHKVLTVVRGNLSDLVMTPVLHPDDELPAYLEMDRRIREDDRVLATAPQLESIVFLLERPKHRAQPTVAGYAVTQLQAVGIDFDREKRVSKIAEYIVTSNADEDPFFSQRELDYFKEGTVIVSQTFAQRVLGIPPPGAAKLPREAGELDSWGVFLGTPREEAEDDEAYALRLEAKMNQDQTQYLSLLERDVGLSFANMSDAGTGGHGRVQATWNTYQFPISAVYDGKDTSLDFTRVYMRIEKLRKLAGIKDEYHKIRVKLKDPSQAEAVRADLLKKFENQYYTSTWEEFRADFLAAVNNEKVLLAIVLSFIVLLGGFIILATLTLTVVEKTRDIGVLSALGATRRGILELFVGNGFLIGVVGSVLGVGLGYLFTNNVNEIKGFLANTMGVEVFPAKIYLFREIPTIWSWGSIAWVVGGSLVMAFVAGFIPAARAARMDPIKALRHE